MAKTTLDQVLEALEAVKMLKDTAGKHERAIGKIVDRLDRLEKQIDIPPKTEQQCRAGRRLDGPRV
jgi:hypothetical protein